MFPGFLQPARPPPEPHVPRAHQLEAPVWALQVAESQARACTCVTEDGHAPTLRDQFEASDAGRPGNQRYVAGGDSTPLIVGSHDGRSGAGATAAMSAQALVPGRRQETLHRPEARLSHLWPSPTAPGQPQHCSLQAAKHWDSQPISRSGKSVAVAMRALRTPNVIKIGTGRRVCALRLGNMRAVPGFRESPSLA